MSIIQDINGTFRYCGDPFIHIAIEMCYEYCERVILRDLQG